MSRFLNCALGAVAASLMLACSDATGPQTAQLALSQTARFSGSGGGGTTTGGGGGGGGTVAPAPVPPACSLLSLTPKSGYTPQGFSYAAIWVNLKLKNCGTTPISVRAELMLDLTGQPLSSSTIGNFGTMFLQAEAPFYDYYGGLHAWTAQPGDSLMITLDFDFQNYSTSYTSTVNVKDFNTGALLATCSTVDITPKPRGGGTGGGGNGSSDTACYK